MIIHAEVVLRERIFIICLFKLLDCSSSAACPREIALLSLLFRINPVFSRDYWEARAFLALHATLRSLAVLTIPSFNLVCPLHPVKVVSG